MSDLDDLASAARGGSAAGRPPAPKPPRSAPPPPPRSVPGPPPAPRSAPPISLPPEPELEVPEPEQTWDPPRPAGGRGGVDPKVGFRLSVGLGVILGLA